MLHQNADQINDMATFLARYYADSVAEVAQAPSEHPALWIDYDDLYQFDAELADDLHERAHEVLDALSTAVPEAGADFPVEPPEVPVRVEGLPETHTYAPTDLRHEHGGKYVAVEGILDRVTTTSDLPERITFECQRCGMTATIPQSTTDDELTEPHECHGCERQGPFTTLHDHPETEWRDYAKIRVQGEPGADGDASIDGHVLDELIDHGGDGGLLARGGEPVTVCGIVERVQKTGRGANELLFDHVLDVRAISFDRDADDVNVADHRETFEALAERGDAVDQFASSIVPEHHITDAWEAALEFAVAYLFGAPRIDIDGGPTYRGDLHFLIITDYGKGKSAFLNNLAQFSPKSISKSATALSSGVGLTAAAVKDDFGAGQWTVKPGLLARASPGHLLLDEIDKGPDDLTDMNDALEGEQVVDVEKAGQSATYESRTAVLAAGNPVDGRFDRTQPVADQLDISESLLSRFDGIVTMEDTADEETDAAIAESFGKAYTEAQELAHGDRDERDKLDRPVPTDVGRAWVKYAREHVNPILRYEQFETLQSWYAEEIRRLNEDFAGDGQGKDMPVPATVRELAAAAKMSIAFARCHLREEVTDTDVERAKSLAKRLVAQNWDGEQFQPEVTKPKTQKQRKERIREVIPTDEEVTPAEIAEQVNVSEKVARDELETLAQNGHLARPSTGVYRGIN